MTFYARPNLDNIQFKQLKGGEPLTLSGQTQIATTSGLTLATGSGATGVIITASGASSATNNHVLTYDHGIQKIVLKESSGSGGTGFYDGTSPTTCTVGGLDAETEIAGQSISSIIQQIVAPTIAPSITEISASNVAPIPSNTLYEVGSSFDLCASISFNCGSINPYYPTGLATGRTYGVSGYTFNFKGLETSFIETGAPSYTYDCFSGVTITEGNNELVGCVSYCDGPQPYLSDGTTPDPDCDALTAGYVLKTRIIKGVYPWFWGTSATAPTIGQTLINGYNGKCCQSNVSGNVVVSNFNASEEYIWFAIPTGNTKTSWQGANNVSNNGVIPGGLFPTPTIITINSPESLWGTPQSYEVYVSNYATDINYAMTFS